ncbi:MAG: hypothetical protein RJA80_117, partial [Actinomycetota bacterium]
MDKLRVGVLFGGRSSEHEISCISANSIINVIDRNKYEVVPIGLTKDNQWVIFEDRNPFLKLEKKDLPVVTTNGIQDNKAIKVSKYPPEELISLDVIFPVLHGPYGEDGTIQGLIDMHAIAFVGAGVLASAIAAFFYVRVIIMMFFTDPANDSVSVVIPSIKSRISIAIATLATFVLGIFPSIILNTANNFANFPINPEVTGIPAKLSNKSENTDA